jgi:hypothetical protein
VDKSLLHSMLLLAAGSASFTTTAAHAALSCAALSQELKLPNTTITLATEVAAGGLKLPVAGGGPGGPPMNFAALPAFCRVAGTIRPTADSTSDLKRIPVTAGTAFVGGGNGVSARSPMAT